MPSPAVLQHLQCQCYPFEVLLREALDCRQADSLLETCKARRFGAAPRSLGRWWGKKS